MADDLIEQLTSDPDFLRLPEHDQDQLYEELVGQQRRTRSPFQDIAPVTGEAINLLGFGVPRFLMQKAQGLSKELRTGEMNPLTETPMGRGMSRLFLSEPETVGGKIAKTAVDVAPLIPAGVGLAKAGIGAGKTLLSAGRFLISPSYRNAMAQGTRKIFEQIGSGAGNALETELSQLPGQVNLKPKIMEFINAFQNVDVQKALGQAIAKAASVGDDTLARFLNQPSLAEKASVLDAHRVAVTLEQIPEVQRVVTLLRSEAPQRGAKFVQRATPLVMDFLKHAKDIRGEAEQVAGSAFQTARSKFGETAQSMRKLSPFFSEKNLVRNIATKFGGPFGSEVASRVARTLPRQTMQEISRIPRGLLGLSLLGATTVGKRFLSPRHIEAVQALPP